MKKLNCLKIILPLICLLVCSKAYPVATTVATVSLSQGQTSVSTFRVDFSTNPITTTAYGSIISSTIDNTNNILISSSSSETFVFSVGALNSEVPQFYIGPLASGSVPLAISAGSRVSIKPVTSNATTNAITFGFLK